MEPKSSLSCMIHYSCIVPIYTLKQPTNVRTCTEVMYSNGTNKCMQCTEDMYSMIPTNVCTCTEVMYSNGTNKCMQCTEDMYSMVPTNVRTCTEVMYSNGTNKCTHVY